MMLFGWAIGLIIAGLVIRLGLGAESLAWAAIFFIQPFSAVYYPIDTLPPPVRWIAYLLPSAPVFEGMRAVLVEHRFDWALFGQAVARAAGLGPVGAASPSRSCSTTRAGAGCCCRAGKGIVCVWQRHDTSIARSPNLSRHRGTASDDSQIPGIHQLPPHPGRPRLGRFGCMVQSNSIAFRECRGPWFPPAPWPCLS